MGVRITAPAQARVERAVPEQPAEAPEPDVALALELGEPEPSAAIRSEELGGAAAGVPLEAKGRKRPRELAEGDPVAARVGVTAAGVLDRAPGHGLADDLGEVAHLVVRVVVPDVERLGVDELARRFEQERRGPRDVADVDERPPRSPVAQDPHLARRVRPADEVVEHEIEPQPRRDAVDGRVPHEHGRERGAGALEQRRLRFDLRLGVRGQRRELRGLVERTRPGRGAVHAAGRREDEARDPRGAAGVGERDGRVEVDCARQPGVEVAERVVREAGEVHDGVEALDLRRPGVADVEPLGRHGGAGGVEVAALVEEGVEAGDVVARVGEHLGHDRPDVAVVAGDENLHPAGNVAA